jgi:flavin-binding protein dodecin
MSEAVYKKIQVVGCSEKSYEDAIANAVHKGSESLHSIYWWEVLEMRGAVKDGKPAEYQVTINLAFKVD